MEEPVAPPAPCPHGLVVYATGIEALRTELADLAFALDRRGHPEAADVALWTSGRLADLQENLAHPSEAWSESATIDREE